MRRHQRHISAVCAVTVLAFGGVASTSAAHGGTLLSGYGTTGEGNQALLGSTLLGGGGSKGGGGGSGGSGGGQGVDQAAGSQGAGVQTTGSVGASTGAGGSSAVRTTTSSSNGSRRRGHPVSPPARRSAKLPAAGTSNGSHTLFANSAHATSASVSTLGITGTDLLYILLGVGGLVLTGIFTRQLARRPH